MQQTPSFIEGGILSPLICLALTTVLLLGAQPIVALMRAPAEAFALTVRYVRICGAGAVFIVAYNVQGSAFRGVDDSKMPLITVAIACAINIAGDLNRNAAKPLVKPCIAW